MHTHHLQIALHPLQVQHGAMEQSKINKQEEQFAKESSKGIFSHQQKFITTIPIWITTLLLNDSLPQRIASEMKFFWLMRLFRNITLDSKSWHTIHALQLRAHVINWNGWSDSCKEVSGKVTTLTIQDTNSTVVVIWYPCCISDYLLYKVGKGSTNTGPAGLVATALVYTKESYLLTTNFHNNQ